MSIYEELRGTSIRTETPSKTGSLECVFTTRVEVGPGIFGEGTVRRAGVR